MKVRKFFKKGLLIGTFAASLIFASNAYAATEIIVDNDSTTWSNDWTPGSTWTKLSVGNYGDSRIHKDSAAVKYYWTFSNKISSGFWGFYVYLNNASFNNTSTHYYKDGSPTYTINQDTAVAGYNFVEDVVLSKDTGYTFSVSASAPVSTQDTGADTIKFVD